MKAAGYTSPLTILPYPIKNNIAHITPHRLTAILLVAMTLWSTPTLLRAQEPARELTVEDARKRAYKGYYMDDIDGEHVMMIVLNEVVCYPQLKFKNKKEEEFYWRTVRDVRRALPYAKVICETMIETYEYIETLPTKEERDRHIKEMEGAVFEQYKPVLKKFTKSQAQMLCKLINRETDQSSYNILKAFLGTFRAGFWQTFGRLFGVNLRTDYRPEKNDKDAVIERVATMIEQGQL